MSWNNYIPISLPEGETMSEDEFFYFCAANKHIKIERDINKQTLIIPPAGLELDNQTFTIALAIGKWNDVLNKGICFGASAGFTLPDGSVRSPDAAWLSAEKWNALSKKDRKTFGHVVPDFVVEVMSPSDEIIYMQKKMQLWIQNGVRLGWLIYPEENLMYVYRANATVSKIDSFQQLISGEDVLENFTFDLSTLLL